MKELRAFGANDSTVSSVSNRRSYDTAFKRLFSRKDILSVILKEIVPEYKELHPTEIQKLISTSSMNAIDAETLSEEDVSFGSKIVYDILVECILPHNNHSVDVGIIFDLEMQRKYNLPYSILDRATYYASRLLARQSAKNYGDLMPVYSTWICLQGIPKSLQNTVHKIRMTDYSDMPVEIEKSLLNIDMLLLSEDYDWNVEDDTVVKFLQAVFKDRLQDVRFNPYLRINEDLKKEMKMFMSEQDQLEYEARIEREEARSEGLAEGRAEGRVEGRAEGRNETIFQLFKDGVITKEIAAERLNLVEEKFDKEYQKWLAK